MPYANTTYTYTSPTVKFSLPFLALKDAHLKAKVDITGVGTYVADTGFTVTDGGLSITFGDAITGGVAWVSGTTLVNLYRETPIADADRIVDFQSGSVLTEADLDNSALQVLYAAQESADVAATVLGETATGTEWDAETKKIINVAEPTLAQDAATKSYTDTVPLNRVTPGGTDEWDADTEKIVNVVDPTADQDAATKKYVDDVTVASGNLPDVSGGTDDNKFLAVQGTAWAKESASQARTTLGLGTAAEVNTGTGAGDVPTITSADARYALEANNLSDLANATTARTNLGLDTAATVATGTGASDIALNSQSKAMEARHGLMAVSAYATGAGYVPHAATGGGAFGTTGETDDLSKLVFSSSNFTTVNNTGDTTPTLALGSQDIVLPDVGSGAGIWKISWGVHLYTNSTTVSPIVCFCIGDEDGNLVEGEKHSRTVPHGEFSGTHTSFVDFSSSRLVDLSSQDSPVTLNLRCWQTTLTSNTPPAGDVFVSNYYILAERMSGTPT